VTGFPAHRLKSWIVTAPPGWIGLASTDAPAERPHSRAVRLAGEALRLRCAERGQPAV
jgi:hypothetical protein